MSKRLEILGADLDRLQKSLSFYEELYVKGEKIAFAKEMIGYYKSQVKEVRSAFLTEHSMGVEPNVIQAVPAAEPAPIVLDKPTPDVGDIDPADAEPFHELNEMEGQIVEPEVAAQQPEGTI